MTEPGSRVAGAPVDGAGSAPGGGGAADVAGPGGAVARSAYDAIVLAGGRARRLGGASKPDVEVGGIALLDHALAAVVGAAHVVVVGPPEIARPGIATVLEDPPDGGPVAGLAAGLDALPGDGPELVLVLACDVPGAGRVLPALLAATATDASGVEPSRDHATGVDGARMVGAEGRPQHLVAVYRRASLRAALDRLPAVHGVAMHRLVEGLRLVDVVDGAGATADVDTWADVETLDAALSDRIDP